MRCVFLATLLGSAGLGGAATPDLDAVIAQPQQYSQGGDDTLRRAIGQIAGRGDLFDQLEKWEADLEKHPDSVRLLLLVATARAYFPSPLRGEEKIKDFPRPVWMRLHRTGDEVEAFVSADGHDWQPIVRKRLHLGPEAVFGVVMRAIDDTPTALEVDHLDVSGGEQRAGEKAAWRLAGLFTQASRPFKDFDGSLSLKDLGDPPGGDDNWVAATKLTGDGEITARIADFQDHGRYGAVGITVRNGDTWADANICILTGRNGAVSAQWAMAQMDAAPLWKRIVDLAPREMGYRVRYAQELGSNHDLSANELFKALAIDPVATFVAGNDPGRRSNTVVPLCYVADRLPELSPYVDRLKPENFQDREIFANLMRTLSACYQRMGKLDLARAYMDRAMETSADFPKDPSLLFELLSNAVALKDPDRIRSVSEQVFALPVEGDRRSAEERAAWRQELNRDRQGFRGGENTNTDFEWVPFGRRFLSMARSSGQLSDLAARLQKEPARYGKAACWDFVRLAALAAERSPAARPDIEALDRELPGIVRESGPKNPWWDGSGAPIGPTRKRLEELRSEEARQRPCQIDLTAAMFLCVPQFYAWPETRPVAFRWLEMYATEQGLELEARLAAASLWFDYAQWSDDPGAAKRALDEAAIILMEEIRRRGSLGDLGKGLFRKMVGAMAQYGMDASVQEIIALMHDHLSTVGFISAPMILGEADFRTSRDPGVVSLWPRGEGENRSLQFTIEPAFREKELGGVQYALGRRKEADAGSKRTVELQGSNNGTDWTTFAKVSTSRLAGTWTGAIPIEARFVRGLIDGKDSKAIAVSLPAGRNLLGSLATVDGELKGWTLPKLSSVHMRDSELSPGAPMVTWISENFTKSSLCTET